MSLPYFIRLLLLSLATFFIVHFAVGTTVSLLARRAVRFSERIADQISSSWAARFLLALRLTPLAVATFVVVGLCIPSYLRLEPAATAEQVGWACVGAAMMGLAIWFASMTRALRAIFSSLRYGRRRRREGKKSRLAGQRAPVWIVDAGPLMATAGILQPKLVISRDVLSALSPDQLEAAMLHERAHRISCDNLQRLIILSSPDILPFAKSLKRIEAAWARLTEWAADDRAVAGNSQRSLSLAAALVQVARMGVVARPSPLTASLVAEDQDLEARVSRLLKMGLFRQKSSQTLTTFLASSSLAMVAVLVVLLLDPSTFARVHGILEMLIR